MVIEKKMEKIMSLCKRKGFIFQSSEIYGGINGFWDYGPYGVEMRRAIEQLWWNYMVKDRENVVGLDSTIISHPRVWEASGHTAHFNDFMVDNKISKKRFRIDKLLEEQDDNILKKLAEIFEISTNAELIQAKLLENASNAPQIMKDAGVLDPSTKKLGEWTEPRQFNLMMKTYVGPVADEDHQAYLRAETCQPIFVDFHTVRIASRQKLPFGIAQVGKAFRNEINPRNFTFRSREFSQMEMEFFCHDKDSMEWFEYWKKERINYYKELLQFDDDVMRIHDHDQLAHYAKAALDIEFKFPFGWGELEGVHHRGTWDMSRHAEYSKENMQYLDQETKERYYPTVVETSVGLDRTMLALLCNAYHEDEAETQKEGKSTATRIVMKLPANVAPVQVAVLPLSKKLAEYAQPLYSKIKNLFRSEYDDGGSIGKRYRRQDEIGTPFCVTFDFDSIDDKSVTVRKRDEMTQERVSLDQLVNYITENM